MTVGNVDNFGANIGSTAAGIGVDYAQPDSDDFFTGGALAVTGTFTNEGDFAVGDVSQAGVISDTTVNVATFDNQSTAGVDILAGQVTIGTLNNAGASTTAGAHAGFGIDSLPGEPGNNKLGSTLLSKVTIATLNNTGDFAIGNSGMSGSAVASVTTLDSTGDIVLTAGTSQSSAELDLAATPSNWTGDLELDGGTSGIAGTARVVMEDNRRSVRSPSRMEFALVGVQAFVADANDSAANSALQGLQTVNGTLGSRVGRRGQRSSGNLTNNGGLHKTGGIAIDFRRQLCVEHSSQSADADQQRRHRRRQSRGQRRRR